MVPVAWRTVRRVVRPHTPPTMRMRETRPAVMASVMMTPVRAPVKRNACILSERQPPGKGVARGALAGPEAGGAGSLNRRRTPSLNRGKVRGRYASVVTAVRDER